MPHNKCYNCPIHTSCQSSNKKVHWSQDDSILEFEFETINPNQNGQIENHQEKETNSNLLAE